MNILNFPLFFNVNSARVTFKEMRFITELLQDVCIAMQ